LETSHGSGGKLSLENKSNKYQIYFDKEETHR
jgi:hypothetical protein